MIANTNRIGFRVLETEDLPAMHRWLNAPHVARWWDGPKTLDEAQAKYAPRIAGKEPVRCFAVLYDAKPIGYIQTYRISDHPEYAKCVAVDDAASGVDVFIGEEDYTRRGLGAPMIAKFLREIVFADREVTSCVIGPALSNRAAIRAYEKAGFRYVKTVNVPGEPESEYLMVISRSAVAPEARGAKP